MLESSIGARKIRKVFHSGLDAMAFKRGFAGGDSEEEEGMGRE
jgi:hypothetical protein